MENNRSKLESHGYLINGIAEKLEIQISQSGDAARYQSHNCGEVWQSDRRRELCSSYVPHEESTIHCA